MLSSESCSLRHEFAAELLELDVLGIRSCFDPGSVTIENGWGLRGGRPTRRITLRAALSSGHGLDELERERLEAELGRLLGSRSEMETPVDVHFQVPVGG